MYVSSPVLHIRKHRSATKAPKPRLEPIVGSNRPGIRCVSTHRPTIAYYWSQPDRLFTKKGISGHSVSIGQPTFQHRCQDGVSREIQFAPGNDRLGSQKVNENEGIWPGVGPQRIRWSVDLRVFRFWFGEEDHDIILH